MSGNIRVISVYFFLKILISCNCKVEVKIRQGTIIGTTETSVFSDKQFYAFYGIPYARAPVGNLRFKNPVNLKDSRRHFDASTEYRGACAQLHIVHKHGLYGSEDCLYVNIYTPGLNKGKAVIIWIHGYAFTSSFSHIHGGDFLVDHDIVVVTLTHRISVFGFLKVNNSDQHINMGFKDIIKGLKWVQNNIENFGGDKNQVTLMGSGSGATYISLLMITKFKRLFSKVILQSGTLFSPSLYQGDPVEEKNKLEKALKVAGYENIMKVPTKDITLHSAQIYSNKDIINTQRPLIPFLPITKTNKNYFSSNISRLIEKLYLLKDMPVMIGFTSQESITELIPFIHNSHYLNLLKTFKYMVPFSNSCSYKYGSRTYREIGNLIKKYYFKGNIDKNSLQYLLKYVSDLHKYPIYKFIQLYLEATQSKAYVYKFNYVGSLNAAKITAVTGTNKKIKGAAQGDEICYIFKCEPLWEDYVKLKQDSFHRDRIFIAEIAEMWANFAKNGQPSSLTQNCTWLPMTKQDDFVYLFGKENKLVDSEPERIMYTFWDKIYDNYYSPDSCVNQNYRDEL